jgi:hypothetical protein
MHLNIVYMYMYSKNYDSRKAKISYNLNQREYYLNIKSIKITLHANPQSLEKLLEKLKSKCPNIHARSIRPKHQTNDHP